ncbi:MAG: hypothetical protein DMG06_29470 [Acidobacteria bacterium]|nr:MAG: hypothetical protein DMG06_29470 [Acidobacteriota bacterium]
MQHYGMVSKLSFGQETHSTSRRWKPRSNGAATEEKVFEESRQAFLEVLKLISTHTDDTIEGWKRLLRDAGLSSEEVHLLTEGDYRGIVRGLRRLTFQSFRNRLTQLGEELARRGVGLEHVISAHTLLFEACRPFLQDVPSEEKKRLITAAARVHSMAVRILVSGYAKYSDESKATLMANLSDVQQRLLGSSAYVTTVYERERRRLSHDLHDEIGHALIMLKLYLEMIAMDLDRGKVREARPRMEEALSLVSSAIDAVRRLVQDLGPAIFDELGFLSAIKRYTRQFSARTGIQVTILEAELPENIPMSHQVALYRILQGALSNVMKHSKAKNVKLSLGSMKSSVLIMRIEDDGTGFDVDALSLRRSFGLTAMRERAQTLRGKLHIQSSRAGLLTKGHGTRIEVDLPLGAAERR